jgi:hypothetical protein
MTLQIIIATAAAIGLGIFLAIRWSRRAAAFRDLPDRLFGPAKAVLVGARAFHGETAGVIELVGRYEGHEVRAKAIADTLAVRKLPSLWLMVTLPGSIPVEATFDLMMRPAGPSSFSHFDNLPVTVVLPAGFPEEAAVRTDDVLGMVPPGVVLPHIGPFFGRQAKELLITPKGIRLVYLLAEADRARYGVFRQADFGDTTVGAELLEDMITRLLALKRDIATWKDTAS